MAKLEDDAIQRRVTEAIGFHPRANVLDMRVEVHNGIARLEGVVDSLEIKQNAEEVARSVEGVRRVKNDLTVEDPRGLKDLDIGHEVNKALEADSAVDTAEVGATVEDSTAYLVGYADNIADEEAAMRAASRADGVKAVISSVDISPGRDVDWVDVKNAVVDALDAAEDFYPYGIDVSVETDGRVVLTGNVGTEADRERAERIASRVDGAKSVVNRLQTPPR